MAVIPKTPSMKIVGQKGASRNRPTLPGWQRIQPVFGSAKESRVPAKALGDDSRQRTPPQLSRCFQLEHCRPKVRIGRRSYKRGKGGADGDACPYPTVLGALRHVLHNPTPPSLLFPPLRSVTPPRPPTRPAESTDRLPSL